MAYKAKPVKTPAFGKPKVMGKLKKLVKGKPFPKKKKK